MDGYPTSQRKIFKDKTIIILYQFTPIFKKYWAQSGFGPSSHLTIFFGQLTADMFFYIHIIVLTLIFKQFISELAIESIESGSGYGLKINIFQHSGQVRPTRKIFCF